MNETWQPAFRFIRHYLRVLNLVWKTNPLYSILAVFLTLCSAVVPPTQIWITKLMIDRIVEMVQGPPQALPMDWYAVFAPIGVLVLVWSLGTVCERLSSEVKALLSIQVRNHTEYLILQKATRLDIAFFEDSTFYDQMDTVLREGHRAHNLAYRSIDMLGSFVGIGAMLGLLLQLHPLAIVVLLLTSAPQAIVGGYYANRFYGLATERAAARRMATYFAELLSSRDAIKEVRLFRLDQPFLDRFRRFSREYLDAEKQFRLSKEWASIFLALLSIMGTAGIWMYAISQAIQSRITLGDVALVLQVAEQARHRLGALFNQAGDLYENNLYTTNLFHFLDLSPDSVEGALARPQNPSRPLISVAQPIQQGIEFRNVSFRYPRSDRYILENFACNLRPGETIALVGENGAGKTTLVKLMVRFYDPTEGSILLDGKDLREYDPDSLRRQMGIIFQDFVRFDLTARENIGFGQIEWTDDLERVRDAAALGGAQSIIDRLPHKFDNMLGRRFEGGVDLSGGEWQKIALSRAFMRDAQILILDEPTAALDALAECEIYQRFAELTAGRTTLFISHRFSTVRVANHILVVGDGALKEEGTHDELMVLNGQYARMYSQQAKRYQ